MWVFAVLAQTCRTGIDSITPPPQHFSSVAMVGFVNICAICADRIP